MYFNEILSSSFLYCLFLGELYVSDKHGSDQDGDGTEQKPFKTPLKVRGISTLAYHRLLNNNIVNMACMLLNFT